MKRFLRIMPWLLLALFGAEILGAALPKRQNEFDLRGFGRLPVLLNGRIQPFDSAARNSLLQIRSTASVPLEQVPSWQFWHHPEKLTASEWLLEVMFRPDLADTRPIFLIHHPELLAELRLSDRGIAKSGLRYYSYRELEGVTDVISDQAGRAAGIDDHSRTPLQRQALKLGHALMLYRDLKSFLPLPDADDPSGEALGLMSRPDDSGAGTLYPLVVPPRNPETDRHAWTTVRGAADGSMGAATEHPAVRCLVDLGSGFRDADATRFNRAVAAYEAWLAPRLGEEVRKGRAEYFYNQASAFLHATIIYICALLLAAGALVTLTALPVLSESLRRASYYLVILAWVVHTTGLVARMVLEGRPPVTNLYSSAVFIGWGAVFLGLALERLFRVGLGVAVASLAGFVTLLIAHNLALGGDTMEMMRAVLDTNFWLATHVVTVTIGYASTFVAGLLAITYILLGVFTPLLSVRVGTGESDLGRTLARMAYGIVCFATLFSFVGTVLGGIWADQSWGRFWGWDPKENGALLIVLWNATFLHVRWGGLLKERGLMAMTVFGNVVTSWSWFGTNMLGIGLHSYGFMDSAFRWLMAFVILQLVFIGLGMVPPRYWSSFRARAKDAGRNAKRPVDLVPPAPRVHPSR